jgi:osmotically inducible protein OsmC
MINRKATAVWAGSGKEGKGIVSTQSGVLDKTRYSFNTRFENGIGTNPEELIAAAHAGCFAMKLSFDLNAAGHTPDELHTTAVVSLDPAQGLVVKSHLTLRAKIDGITDEEFQKIAASSKESCPISKLLKAEIELDASLL